MQALGWDEQGGRCWPGALERAGWCLASPRVPAVACSRVSSCSSCSCWRTSSLARLGGWLGCEEAKAVRAGSWRDAETRWCGPLLTHGSSPFAQPQVPSRHTPPPLLSLPPPARAQTPQPLSIDVPLTRPSHIEALYGRTSGGARPCEAWRRVKRKMRKISRPNRRRQTGRGPVAAPSRRRAGPVGVCCLFAPGAVQGQSLVAARTCA